MTATLDCPAPDAPTTKPRSGGPRTQAGKDASRRNALKHGMRSEVVFPDDLAAAIDRRTGLYLLEFQPVGPYEEWLVGQVALNMTLINRCVETSVIGLQHIAKRAELCWDEDRRHAVETLGAKLSRDPARIVAALRRSKHGALWLIQRWEALGEALRRCGGWDETQRGLAFDLLGTPTDLREFSRDLPADADAETLAALVADQLFDLNEARAEALDELDDDARDLALKGLPFEADDEIWRLRRYEARCDRAMHWALAEFRRVHVKSQPSPSASPAPAPAPVAHPAPLPPPQPSPPRPSAKPGSTPSPSLAGTLSALAATLAPAVEPTPAPAPVPEPAPSPPLCRRARKAKEQQARKAAKLAAKRAGQAR